MVDSAMIPVGDERIIEHTRVRERRGRPKPRIGLNLTAMIDVVFQLLIYFMVATDFRQGEEHYRMDLPERLTSRQPRDPFELDLEPLRITVASTGLAPNGYSLAIEGPYASPATFEALHEFLRERQIAEGNSAGLFEPDHPIIIAPARSASWEHTVEAFNAAARAHYTNIIFARPQQ